MINEKESATNVMCPRIAGRDSYIIIIQKKQKWLRRKKEYAEVEQDEY